MTVGSTTSDPLIGTLIDGRYLVAAKIARGGMATVYRATDQRLGRDIALKVMHAHLAEDEGFVRRFEREARSAARLSHPGVVGVHDQGRDGATVYLAMELVRGKTLRQVLREVGALTPEEALDVAEQVLAGLGAAHELGITHRDIKPENVLITPEGRVKVADFGVARAMTDTTATQTGTVLGTVGYLSPELVTGAAADPRADIYATGILLFEMVTGTQPYRGEVPIQVAFQHVHSTVPAPSSRITWLPAVIDDVVIRLAAKDPEDRPATGAAALPLIRGAHRKIPADVLRRRPSEAELLEHADAIVGGAVKPKITPASGQTAIGPLEGAAAIAAAKAAKAATKAPSGKAPAEKATAGASGSVTPKVSAKAAGNLAASRAAEAQGAGTATTKLATRPPRAAEDSGATETMSAISGAMAAQANASKVAERPPSGKAKKPKRTKAEPKNGQSQVKRRRRLVVILAALLVLLVGGGVGGNYWYNNSGPGSMRTVPTVTGLDLADAEAQLSAADLNFTTSEAFDEKIAPGVVMSSSLTPGDSVRFGTTTDLVVSKGRESFPVPDVVGKDQATAEAALTAEGFVPDSTATRYDEDVAAGIVLDQDPTSTSAQFKGTTIALTISLGKQPHDVPNVVGASLDDAKAAITKADLSVGKVTEDFSMDVGKGFIISQDPADGQLFAGESVKLVMSKGKPQVEVPNMFGMQRKDAQAKLTDLGLVADVQVLPFSVWDKVYSQSVAGGTTVDKGSTITINIG